jgi:type II secretory pathway pseudopilin PulG
VHQDGFSLVEALISLALAVLIMVGATQLLFSTKKNADRMSFNSEAQQAARRAMEYISHHVRTASDLNPEGNNPLAIMVWYEIKGNVTQSSYNNVTNSSFGDLETDIITLAVPNTGMSIVVDRWVGASLNAANAWWHFTMGCPDPIKNVDLFKEMTGYDPDTGMSPPLIVTDANGGTAFYQITNYLEPDNRKDSCEINVQTGRETMHVTATPGQSDGLNPPAAQENLDENARPIRLQLGVQFRAFRVRNGWLEQKDGIFDPATDNPGTNFVPIIPNIEDLQIAYLYNDGTVWNTSTQQLPDGVYANNVPTQGSVAPLPYEVTNVVGMRLTVVARSANEVTWDTARFRRPAAEDRSEAATLDRFYHASFTELAMVRNRNLQR